MDLETGKQVPCPPNIFITKSTGTPFVEGKPSKEFLDLVSLYFCGDQELMDFFARIVGMALLGENISHKFVNLYGDGGNGKGTLMKLLTLAFGKQYIGSMQAEALIQSQKSGGEKGNPAIIKAFGSRVLVINETNEGDELNSAIIKQITGGDEISARKLYANDYVEKRASFTPFILSNKRLYVRHADKAWWRRLVIIPFNASVKQQDTFERKLDGYALDAKRWFLEGVR